MAGLSNKRKANAVLWVECIGFACLIALSWLDELLHLPQRMFGGSARTNWRESCLETLAALVVWLVVFVTTKKMLRRFYDLEEKLEFCPWCRRLEGKDVVLPAEIVGESSGNGACPGCGRQTLAAR